GAAAELLRTEQDPLAEQFLVQVVEPAAVAPGPLDRLLLPHPGESEPSIRPGAGQTSPQQLEHSPAMDESGHDRLLNDEKWGGQVDSRFEWATPCQGAWHSGDIDGPLRDGTERCNTAAQLAHHLCRAPWPERIDGALGAQECDVAAILRLELVDDR